MIIPKLLANLSSLNQQGDSFSPFKTNYKPLNKQVMTTSVLQSISISKQMINYSATIKFIARYRKESVRYTISYVDSYGQRFRQIYYSFDNAKKAYHDCIALYS